MALEGLRVDNDLDDKVLLNLSVLQPRLVREQLPGEEPALVGSVNVVLGLQLLLQLPDGVGHAGAEAQVLARGEAYLQGTGRVRNWRSQTSVKRVFQGLIQMGKCFLDDGQADNLCSQSGHALLDVRGLMQK